jgi:superfamily I DNA/RNA helicase
MSPTWRDGVRGVQVIPLIERDADNVRVEAGPGTGKTFGLVRRIERLMSPDGLGVHGAEVLVVAFNRVIARQLNLAIQQRLDTFDHEGDPRIRTIHALCLEVVGDELRIVLPHERECMIYDVRTVHPDVAQQFGNFKGTEQALRDHEAGIEEHLTLWQATREWLTRHRAQLLSDLPALFSARIDGGDLPEHRYQYVIVDEFQDLTPGEQALVFKLKRPGGQLVALGDSRQSIYRFRGNELEGLAKITEIAEARGETLVDIPMQECQRCPREVVLAANRLMALAGVQEMAPVSVTPANLHNIVWNSIEDEASGMALAIVENVARYPDDVHLVMTTRRQFGYKLRERIHELAPQLRIELNFSEGVLEEWAAREAFLFFSLIADADAPTWRAWLGYVNSATGKAYKAPERNSAAYLAFLDSTADAIDEAHVRSLAEEPRLRRRGTGGAALWDRAHRFVELKDGLIREGMSEEEIIEQLFDGELWIGNEYDEPETARLDLEQMRIATLARLEKRKEQRPQEPSVNRLRYIARQLRYAVGTKEPLVEDTEAPDIMVATLWGAKGVTADHVYILGVCKEAIPGTKREEYPGTEAEYVAEQKRLFYVSITRTTRTLVFSRARAVHRNEASRLGLAIDPQLGAMVQLQMSPFLREILTVIPAAMPGANWPGCG